MAFNALLMCREESTLRYPWEGARRSGGPAGLPIGARGAGPDRATALLGAGLDLPGAATVARMARLAPSSRRPVIFGMIGALTETPRPFKRGELYLLQAARVEQMVRCLRAGRGFMQPDRRKSPRQSLESLVYLQFGIAALPRWCSI